MKRDVKHFITFKTAGNARNFVFAKDYQGETYYHTDNIIGVVTWKRRAEKRMKKLALVYGSVAIRKVC